MKYERTCREIEICREKVKEMREEMKEMREKEMNIMEHDRRREVVVISTRYGRVLSNFSKFIISSEFLFLHPNKEMEIDIVD